MNRFYWGVGLVFNLLNKAPTQTRALTYGTSIAALVPAL